MDLDSIMLTTAGEADQSALQTGTSSGGITIGMEDDFDDSDDESGSDLSDSEISAAAAGVSGTTSGIPGGQLKTWEKIFYVPRALLINYILPNHDYYSN